MAEDGVDMIEHGIARLADDSRYDRSGADDVAKVRETMHMMGETLRWVVT